MREEILAFAFGSLWMVAGVAMVGYAIGMFLSMWPQYDLLWWVALAALVGVGVVSVFSKLSSSDTGRTGEQDDSHEFEEWDAAAPSTVYSGQITRGFHRWQRRESGRGESDVVRIEHVPRMHHFDVGYRDSGQPRSLTEDLTERDARAVRDLLDDWLAEREGQRGETGET